MDTNTLWQFAITHLQALRTNYGFAASDASTGLYHTLFGRDSLWVLLFLLEAVKLKPETSFTQWVEEAGTDIFRSLCTYQGTVENDLNEEQPGKIIHEYRSTADQKEKRLDDMRLGFVEGRLYSGFDQTFLFVSVFRLFCDIFPKAQAIKATWPHFEQALQWIETYADADQDGLYEYQRRNPRNLLNQVWKDSFDSAVTTGVDIPPHPLAWIEIQAYGYRALLDAAELYERNGSGNARRLKELRSRAQELQHKAASAFWMEEHNCFAMALTAERSSDGSKKKVEVVSSNAAHTLWAEFVLPDQRNILIERLLENDMTTDFGLRTVSSKSSAYAPFAYHRGCIWPFDTAVFVIGLLRAGYSSEAQMITKGVSQALTSIGSPIELYVVLEPGMFVQPQIDQTALLVRRIGQENRNQAWTAAAALFFAALLGVDLTSAE